MHISANCNIKCAKYAHVLDNNLQKLHYEIDNEDKV